MEVKNEKINEKPFIPMRRNEVRVLHVDRTAGSDRNYRNTAKLKIFFFSAIFCYLSIFEFDVKNA